MDLVKYLVAGGISLVIAIAAMFMGNVLSGILIFVLLFGTYITWNIINDIKDTPPQNPAPPVRGATTPTKDN